MCSSDLDETLPGTLISGVRKLSVSEKSVGAYDWTADKTLPAQENEIPSWLGTSSTGNFALEKAKDGSLVLTANTRLCRKSKHDLATTLFRKLSYQEAVAYGLPAALLEGLPSLASQTAEAGSVDASNLEEQQAKNLGSETESDEGR